MHSWGGWTAACKGSWIINIPFKIFHITLFQNNIWNLVITLFYLWFWNMQCHVVMCNFWQLCKGLIKCVDCQDVSTFQGSTMDAFKRQFWIRTGVTPTYDAFQSRLLLVWYNSHYYLLKIIQKFWLVKSGGWNRHIRSLVCQNSKYKWLLQGKGSQIQMNNKTIIEFGSRRIRLVQITRTTRGLNNSSYPTWPHSIIVYYFNCWIYLEKAKFDVAGPRLSCICKDSQFSYLAVY